MATVISTEDAIEMLPPNHTPPSNYLRNLIAATLLRQGLIEPICAVGRLIGSDGDPWDVARVYAAVELGWDTVLVDFEGRSSG